MKDFKLPLMAAMSTAMLAGCTPGGDPAAFKICVDSHFTRVDDRLCDADDKQRGQGGGFVSYRWYYMRQGTGAPGVGAMPSDGSLSPAEADSSYARASTAGESISRGGFGSSAGHSGGGGDAGE